MNGLYFSGTGNTKYCVELLVHELDPTATCYSIEDPVAIQAIQQTDSLVLAYPIYYSNLPKIMQDFLAVHHSLFSNKKVFFLVTMGLFSGDGSGCGARLLRKMGATIWGGCHIKMPDCIADEKVLKKLLEQNQKLVKQANAKIIEIANQIKQGHPTQQGLHLLSQLAGFFGQRCWFYQKTQHYVDKLKIKEEKCIGCGLCVTLCPMNNLVVDHSKAKSFDHCTMCYRCVNHCPRQAISLLGTTIVEQSRIEKYL